MGGQSIPAFDYYMAPGVAKTMVSELVKVIDIYYNDIDTSTLKEKLREVQEKRNLLLNEESKEEIYEICKDFVVDFTRDAFNRVWDKALKYVDSATHQAMEALIHNLNSMHSRAGSQVTGAVSL